MRVDTNKRNIKQDYSEKQGVIMRDFKVGNTRILINDAYCCDKTSTDVQAILARISNRVQKQLFAQTAYIYQVKNSIIIDNH